uniref:Nephronophthisis 1 n=1 Tax=Neolamprologus brichardi TaxID=32507 RepID=A0A3Q4MND3_NEOBR
MPLKRRGPLQLAQREVDEIKKQCLIFQGDELAPVGNYDQRKQEEERRVQNIVERLKTLSLELSPPGPSTEAGLVKYSNDNEEEHVENDNNIGGDERRDLKPPSQSDARIYMVLSDFKGEQEGDLSVRKGEVLRIIRKTADGWWLAQNTKGSRGVVPKTFLKVQNENQDSEELTDDPDKFCLLIQNVALDRSIFTCNPLCPLLGVIYRGSHYIQPQLSQSQLSFKDLFLDPDTGKVSLSLLWSCRMIPTPGVGVQVLSRHVRLCAFDGTQVLSNIHIIRAAYNAKSPKTWSFSPRVTGILPTLLDGDCFLRCNSASPNLGILFELGVTFIRNSTGERGDLSCGWAFLKLTDDAGNPVPNRTYELPVNGGTPYEKDVAVEASPTRGSPSGVFQQMLQARRQPKLVVKLKSANSRTQTQLSVLPDTLLLCLNCIHLLVLHRHLLADALLMDRPTVQNADLICSPILSTFPVLLDQPDLLDALRVRKVTFVIQIRFNNCSFVLLLY